MILGAFFKKLWAVAFSGPKSGNDTSPSGISNDELVTAYEWVVNSHLIGVPVATDAVCGRVYRVSVPLSVDATLRKMGVR